MRLLGIAAAAMLAVSCATMAVSSHVQRGLDFTQYRTYNWGEADPLPAGDPRLDKDAHLRDHLLGAVDKQLAQRGFEQISASPDLLVHFHASATRRLDVNRLDREKGYCDTPDCDGSVFEFEAGTIVLDVVDARTHRLVWRGWAQQDLNDLLGSSDRMARTIDEAVRRMLDRFPVTRAAAKGSGL